MKNGAECPGCGRKVSSVYDSRPSPIGKVRRRRCHGCTTTWKTYEINADYVKALEHFQKHVKETFNLMGKL